MTDTDPARKEIVMSKRSAKEPKPLDEARIRARLDDPEVKARIEEVRAAIRAGTPMNKGITAEELPAFLREHQR